MGMAINNIDSTAQHSTAQHSTANSHNHLAASHYKNFVVPLYELKYFRELPNHNYELFECMRSIFMPHSSSEVRNA